MTNDLGERITSHIVGAGGKFAKKCNLTKLAYFETFSDIRDAIARLKTLKRWRRKGKIALVAKSDPAWSESPAV